MVQKVMISGSRNIRKLGCGSVRRWLGCIYSTMCHSGSKGDMWGRFFDTECGGCLEHAVRVVVKEGTIEEFKKLIDMHMVVQGMEG